MSRSAAKVRITLTEFEKSMEGIYSSTINRSTIDEAPFAYKPMEEIVAKSTGTIVGRAAVLTEGAAAQRKDIISLAPLPLIETK